MKHVHFPMLPYVIAKYFNGCSTRPDCEIQVSHVSLCLRMYLCVLSGLVCIGMDRGRIDLYIGI